MSKFGTIWWYILVLKCHLAASYGNKFDKVPSKGQIKPKADWCAVDSPKTGMNLFCLLFCFPRQTKQIHLFVFWENLWGVETAFGFTWPLVVEIRAILPSIVRFLDLWAMVFLPFSSNPNTRGPSTIDKSSFFPGKVYQICNIRVFCHR